MMPNSFTTAREGAAATSPLCCASLDFQHSYREDDNRYPRDFWHVRISCCVADTGWQSYGEQEQEVANFHVKQQAEMDIAAQWNARTGAPQ